MRPGAVGAVIVLTSLSFACAAERFPTTEDIGVCDPAAPGFTTTIDNPYFPLPVGQRTVLEGEEFFRDVLVRITVLDETVTVAGVQTRVVEEYEKESGRLVEISRNFFAQAADGTVCYFGEEVDIYDDGGNVTSHAGAWRADGERNIPGIFMPPTLEVGQAFQQEIAPGVAEDQARVIALGEVVEVPAGRFRDTATLFDVNPLDGSSGEKVYAPGIGLIVDGPAEMTRFEPGD
jgi:hypothetical protein